MEDDVYGYKPQQCSIIFEHHLFFARMMKEHAIFLEVSFAGMNQHIAKEADRYKVQFEKILNQAVKLSHGVLSKDIIQSAELVTEYTQTAEREGTAFYRYFD